MVSRLQGGKGSERISHISILDGVLWVAVDNPAAIYVWDIKVQLKQLINFIIGLMLTVIFRQKWKQIKRLKCEAAVTAATCVGPPKSLMIWTGDTQSRIVLRSPQVPPLSTRARK